MLSRGALRRETKVRFLVPYSISVTVSSYVKPGTVHRLSSRLHEHDNLVLFAHAVSAIVDEILHFSEMVSRGKKAIGELPIASLANVVKQLVGPYVYGNANLLPPLFFASIADALSFALRGDVGDPRDLFTAIGGEQVAELILFVKYFEKELPSISTERLSTRTRTGDLTLFEVFEELSAAGKVCYRHVTRPPDPQCTKVVEKNFLQGYNINVSIVNGYLELLKEDPRVASDSSLVEKLEHAIRLGGMKDKEGAKLLVELDRLMHSKGLLLDDLLVPLLRCVNKVLLR